MKLFTSTLLTTNLSTCTYLLVKLSTSIIATNEPLYLPANETLYLYLAANKLLYLYLPANETLYLYLADSKPLYLYLPAIETLNRNHSY